MRTTADNEIVIKRIKKVATVNLQVVDLLDSLFLTNVTAFDLADVSSSRALRLHLLVCKLELGETIENHVSLFS